MAARRTRHDAPEPPASLVQAQNPDPAAAARAARHRNGLRGFPWFFTKQLFSVTLLVILILIADCIAVAFIMLFEEGGINMTPSQMTRYVAESLYLESDGKRIAVESDAVESDAPVDPGSVDPAVDAGQGMWVLDEHAAQYMEREDVWALVLVDNQVVFEFDVPPNVPRSLSTNDIAVSARYGTIEDYPCFFWTLDNDALLIVGYPRFTFWDMGLHLSTESVLRLPLYALLLLSIDATILLVYVLIRRQRTRRATIPITEALDDLAHGRPVRISVGGDLRDVGKTLNEASALMRQKDEARERWIIGVSHDIRTPLSMIIGHADSLANAEASTPAMRKDAELIRAQSLRIADLVQDLNTATRLEYDTQPIDVREISLAALLRSISVEYINDRLPQDFSLSLTIADDAQEMRFFGDERLISRAVQNLIQNALTHNPEGCDIALSLGQRNGRAFITVVDDGRGMNPGDLAALQERIARSVSVDAQQIHGLGLVLVNRIAVVHGGAFMIQSAAGQGFMATIELPIVPGQPFYGSPIDQGRI